GRRGGPRADRGQGASRSGGAPMSHSEPGRTPLIAGNWKMHKTIAEAEAFVAALLPRLATTDVEVAVCPAFLALAPVIDSARGSRLEVFAQNMHHADQGAFTGEV